ncbi:MAG TPA: response regulator [Myxococcales bacterium]|jgi:CheY-like chemotaxis protein
MNRVVLLVDDEPDITTLFRRVLKRSFDEVHVALSGKEAAEILAKRAVTHLVTDFFLGADEPQGTALVARWRTAYPSIRFAAVFTGRASTKEIGGLPGIDAVFAKPGGFEELIALLNSSP